VKTFFHTFQLKERVRERAFIRVKEGIVLESFGGGGGGGDGGCDSSSSISWGFQKRASFLLLFMVANTSCLLHIPHTVTFC